MQLLVVLGLGVDDVQGGVGGDVGVGLEGATRRRLGVGHGHLARDAGGLGADGKRGAGVVDAVISAFWKKREGKNNFLSTTFKKLIFGALFSLKMVPKMVPQVCQKNVTTT